MAYCKAQKSNPKKIGQDMRELIESPTRGYDHNYVLNEQKRNKDTGLVLAAVLTHESGRYLKVYTTLPGLQVYTGNHLKGQKTKTGHELAPWQGICLEPQFFPDSINHKHFPSTVLGPRKEWKHEIIYEFGTNKK